MPRVTQSFGATVGKKRLPSLRSVLRGVRVMYHFLVFCYILIFRPRHADDIGVMVSITSTIFLISLTGIKMGDIRYRPRFCQITVRIILLRCLLTLFGHPIQTDHTIDILRIIRPFIHRILDRASNIHAKDVTRDTLEAIHLIACVEDIPRMDVVIAGTGETRLILMVKMLIVLQVFRTTFQHGTSIEVATVVPRLQFTTIGALVVMAMELGVVMPVPRTMVLTVFKMHLSSSPFLQQDVLSTNILRRRRSNSSFRSSAPLRHQHYTIGEPRHIEVETTKVARRSRATAAKQDSGTARMFIANIRVGRYHLYTITFRRQVHCHSITSYSCCQYTSGHYTQGILDSCSSMCTTILMVSHQGIRHRRTTYMDRTL